MVEMHVREEKLVFGPYPFTETFSFKSHSIVV